MMPEKVTPIFSPETKDIEAHIRFLYDGMSEYEDGKFEINNLVSGQKYDLDEFDFATGYARTHNSNQSIYIVPSLLSPDAPDTGRCGEKDFYASSVIWCDIDEKHDAEELKKLYAVCKPNRAVVTANHPHRRVQLWWKLSEPITDIDTLNEALLGVCQALGGDTKVNKPCQPMRLGGTVNYPNQKKLNEGRVTEKTIYHELHDNAVDIDFFIKTYPVKNVNDIQQSVIIQPEECKALLSGKLNIQKKSDLREDYAYKMVFASINHLTAKLKRFPTLHEVYDDVWPVYLEKVITRGESLEKDGRGSKFIIGKIKYQLRNFERGAYAKYGLGCLEDVIFNNSKQEEQSKIEKQNIDNSFDILSWSTKTNYQGKAKDIEWLIDGVFPVGAPLMLAAVGGIGKSYKMLEIALRLSKSVLNGGNKKVLGGDIVTHGNVAIFSAEDSYDSIHRRLNAIDPNQSRLNSDYEAFIIPMSEIGGARPLIKGTANGTQVDEFYDVVKEKLKLIPDLKLVVFDPLQAFVDGDISSSNEFAQALYSRCLVPLATELKATILVTHHMRKDGAGNIKTPADARNSIRGVSALVDSGRGTYCMWEVTPEIAASLQSVLGKQYDEKRFVQGAMVKFNDQHNLDVTTYYRDDNGLLVDLGTIDISGEVSGLSTEQCKQALREIRILWESGRPLMLARNSANNIHKWLVKNFKITDKQAKIQVDNWSVRGFDGVTILEEREFKTEDRKIKKGVFVVGLVR